MSIYDDFIIIVLNMMLSQSKMLMIVLMESWNHEV